MNSPLLVSALRVAELHHRGQVRKYTGEPYLVHPVAVATLVKECGEDEYTIAAALLHDTVEDTTLTLPDIRREFGTRVADLVNWVTTIKYPSENRRERKERELDRLAAAPGEAHTIKLADIIDNVPSILEHDPKFAKVFMAEKLALLGVLTRGNVVLRVRAAELIMDHLQKQKEEQKPDATGNAGLRDVLGR